MTGKESVAVTSKATNVTGSEKLSVLGTAGDIGGKSINFTGKVYQGNANLNHMPVMHPFWFFLWTINICNVLSIYGRNRKVCRIIRCCECTFIINTVVNWCSRIGIGD